MSAAASSGSAGSLASSRGYYPGQRKRRKERQQQKMIRNTTSIVMEAISSGEHPNLTSKVAAENQANSGGGGAACGGTLFGGSSSGAKDHEQQLRVPLLNSPELQLRFLNPSDVPEVKRLCGQWFPIDYPDSWYADITSSPERFYSVCAVFRAQIIGIIVAEIRDVANLPKEDSEILASESSTAASFSSATTSLMAPFFGSGRSRTRTAHHKSAKSSPSTDHQQRTSSTKIGYILSLGVVQEFRKRGVASFLLDNLVAYLTIAPPPPAAHEGGRGGGPKASISNDCNNSNRVKALYLHVLTTNFSAISFYENRGFRAHLFLPHYYLIKGRRKDGFTYVLYLNGGHPNWSLVDHAGNCLRALFWSISLLNPWFIAKAVFRKAAGMLVHTGGAEAGAGNLDDRQNGLWRRVRQIAHSSSAAVFS